MGPHKKTLNIGLLILHLCMIAWIMKGVFMLRAWIAEHHASLIPIASAHDVSDSLVFGLTALPAPTITLPPPLDYKTIRSREICGMAHDYGLDGFCPQLIAHLYTENGAMAEDRDGDEILSGKNKGKHCSVGMIQWNICSHENMTVEGWVSLHPEWRDYRYQVRFYLAQMAQRLTQYGSIDRAIASWNPDDSGYLSRVKSSIAFAQKMLVD